MWTLTVVSSKGGCGASLIAANLALALAAEAECLLLDADRRGGTADLLLGLQPVRSWADLLTVASELTEHHLELTACRHESGLQLLASPEATAEFPEAERLEILIKALGRQFVWLVVDAPTRSLPAEPPCSTAHMILLVVTPDPPAMRAAKRWLAEAPDPLRRRTGLIVNQHQANGPIQAEEIAGSLGVSLLASLPADRYAVGRQIHYGLPCVLQDESPFAGGIRLLARRIAAIRTIQAEANTAELAVSDGVGRV